MGKRTARLYNTISLVFVGLSLVWVVFVVSQLAG
jgi:hypothetical protein